MQKKIALVTGGMGGIGTAICKQLCEDGFFVISTYSKPGKEQTWLASMAEQGYEVTAYPCDVSLYEDCQSLVKQIQDDVGQIDVLINNAGITKDASFRKMNKDDWGAVIRTNLDSAFNLCKPVIDHMIEKSWGRIINISSINGQKGQFGQVNYSAAKAGLHGFTMALAQEVAKKGITVNTVSPGYIGTDMVMAVPEDIRNKIISGIPVGRLGLPDEIAALVSFLSSDKAGFITGANFSANGGQHMM